MLLNVKSCLISSMLLLSSSLYHPSAFSATVPLSINVTKDRPTFTIKEESSAGYMWFLDDYDQKLLHLKEHKYHEGQDQWTFQVATEGFKAPRILKIRLLFGDPESTEDYEEHLYSIKVLKKSAE